MYSALLKLIHYTEFWTLLKWILPDYESSKEWLWNNGIKYDL